MPKMTLLDMTQSILNDMDSDEVNSVDATIESYQVASILRDSYFEIINYRLWPEHTGIINLSGLGDTDKPNYLLVEDDVIRMDWIKYDAKEEATDPLLYKDICYMSPKRFLDMVLGRDSTDSNVQTVNGFGDEVLLIYTDQSPTYWTSFDDEYIVFDSYDNTQDSTIQESKVQAYGYVEPTFSLTDTFVPDLPAKAFPYYLAYAKSKCFIALRGQVNEKEELVARKQRAWLSREKARLSGGLKTPNFGRK